jgi:hypothetical protein
MADEELDEEKETELAKLLGLDLNDPETKIRLLRNLVRIERQHSLVRIARLRALETALAKLVRAPESIYDWENLEWVDVVRVEELRALLEPHDG